MAGEVQPNRRMVTIGFQNANRVQQSLLSSIEKKTLIWMAERTPSFIHPDHLTLVGLLSMLGAGLGYWLSGGNRAWLWMVNAMILLNWAGDSLDGTLARVRNRQRPRYGFYVDHVIDAVSTVLLLGGLAASGYISAGIAGGLLVAFLLLSVETYLATYTLGTFHLSHGIFSPTELRLLLIAGNFVLLTRTEVTLFGQRYLLFDVGGVVGIAGMLAMFACAAIRNTATLYREERLP